MPEWNAKEWLTTWCQEHYPEHIIHCAKDSGEVAVFMLQPPRAFGTVEWIVVDYNIWYPGEVVTYQLTTVVK